MTAKTRVLDVEARIAVLEVLLEQSPASPPLAPGGPVKMRVSNLEVRLEALEAAVGGGYEPPFDPSATLPLAWWSPSPWKRRLEKLEARLEALETFVAAL
ncbi:MAG: hypothetical protein GEV13_03165 [Rhodospirillales bacterium]|nr:hypothetical protein [Rhodospirillales bacterium]